MRPHSYGRVPLAGLMFLLLFVMTTGAQEIFNPARLATPQTGHRPDLEAMPSQAPYMPGRLLVKYGSQAANSIAAQALDARGVVLGNSTGIARLDALHRDLQVGSFARAYQRVRDNQMTRDLGVDRWYMLTLPAGTDIRAAAQRFERDPMVEAATPDYQAFPMAVPNDPNYSLQWGHNNTAQMLDYCWGCGGHPSGSPVGTVGFDANAEAAWDGAQGFGSASVVIAIIDSGVDAGHPDLRQVAGYDYGDNDSNPTDNSAQAGHGTACAGVAAGINGNGIGVAGIAGGSSIMPLKVANSAGSMFFSAIQNALYHAADNGADIVSMSLGAAISSDPATDTAIQYAYNAGVTILAATGNENASTISYPAIHSLVIGVGAASPCGERKRSSSLGSELNPGVNADPNGYTCDGERWWGSNYGSSVQDAAGAVDVIAPTILPTTDIQGSGGYDPGNYSLWFNGTSCATPYAAGVAALVISANPGFTPAQVRAALTSTAQDVTSVESGAGWDRYTGYGMVDAAAAVGAGGGGPGPQAYATLPYSTGFESGAEDVWSFATSSATYGRIQITSANGPHGGSYHLTMDVNTNGNYATNEARLHLDLTGETQVDLGFWWKEFGDETHAADGVYFSDNGGSSFTKVLDLPGASYTNNSWQNFNLDLDQLAASAGLTLSDQFVVKFQQYDNYAITTDGFAFDDISVAAGSGGGGGYTTLPYTTGFESGSLDSNWSSASTGNGRVRIATTNAPYAGSYHMLMDSSVSGSYATNEAVLHLDLSGETQVQLDFQWKEFGDETHATDGIYFSSNDGASYVKVHNLNGGSTTNNTWQAISLDVDALASANGLSLTSTFLIKFQQYDNYPITTDGFAFDAISVTAGGGGGGPTYITSETENNGSSGTADGPVGTGVAVSGAISSSTDDDWFYFDVATAGNINISVSIGSSADLDWFLYNSSLTEVARGYTVSNPEAGSYTAAAGRYYLWVDGYNGATSSYTLNVTGGLAKFEPGTPKPSLVFALRENVPNPFNPSTRISFEIPSEGPVRLEIFDARGRQVRVLVDETMKAGSHFAVWDGRDDQGAPASSGSYFYRLKAGNQISTKKMLLLK